MTMPQMSEQINELATALSDAQAQMDFAKKGSNNPFFKSSYADLASVWDVCRQVLPKHGLAVSQTMEPGEGVQVRTTLMHKSGQWISGVIALPPVKNDPQAYGSAVTYGRRYSLAAIVGVIADDDDGEAAMNRNGKGKAKPAPAAPKWTEGKAKDAVVFANSIGELATIWKANAGAWKQYPWFDAVTQLKDQRKAELEQAA